MGVREVYQLLAIASTQTLTLNDGARNSLVPGLIASLDSGGLGAVPFSASQCWALVLQIYKGWDFQAHYGEGWDCGLQHGGGGLSCAFWCGGTSVWVCCNPARLPPVL